MAETVERLQANLDHAWSSLFGAEQEAIAALNRLIDAGVVKIKAEQKLGKATGKNTESRLRALENEWIHLARKQRHVRGIVSRLSATGWWSWFFARSYY